MGLALLLPSAVHHRRAYTRPSLTSGPFARNDTTRRTRSRTMRSTDAVRRCAHRVPSGSCAHMLPCIQELPTPPDSVRLLTAPHRGAPVLTPYAPVALAMGHALVRPYVVSRPQPASTARAAATTL